MADVILFFGSNADTMIATKALKDAGITAKMIPKPASVTSASNLCLSIDGGSEVASEDGALRSGRRAWAASLSDRGGTTCRCRSHAIHPTAAPNPQERSAVTRHHIVANGHTINYTATAGYADPEKR